MKKLSVIFILFWCSPAVFAQDIPIGTQEQLENLANLQQTETEDDSWLQLAEYLRKHPVNLNVADADELKQLIFLTDLQIDNLITYRRLLGKLISIYELQAVPSWDVSTIRKILPFVTLNAAVTFREDVKKRISSGNRSLMIRFSETLEHSVGFDKKTPGTKYLGGPEKIFFRYRYQYKNILQYGLSGDKDAGEQFFRGSEKYGFDAYSFHLFARDMGKIKALALGDFTVNMGQGLIQWQSLAFSKSGEVMNVKRQSAILRPYTSSGEFYFQRGVGATMKFGNAEATGFISFRRLSSNFTSDTSGNNNSISSFQSSGYHRTEAEIEDRNNLRQLAFGGSLVYRTSTWHTAINVVSYHFSAPIIKRAEPYNLFAITGNNWGNASMDFSYTHRNLHLFGEEAVDKNLHTAFLNGLLASVDPRVDISLVQRTIDKRYQAVYGDAFTESTYPTNERGMYLGVSIRPRSGWQLDAYVDVYSFPWLKYLVDAPSYGKDFLAQMTYTHGKSLEIYSRFKTETKQVNSSVPGITDYPAPVPKWDWQMGINYHAYPDISIRERVEMLWYNHNGVNEETGFLCFVDLIVKPLARHYSGNLRLQYFETGGYNSRIYAFESSVLNSFSIPASFGKGYRFYINVNHELKKTLTLSWRWSQTIQIGQNSIGSGLDEIPFNHRTEVSCQLQWFF